MCCEAKIFFTFLILIITFGALITAIVFNIINLKNNPFNDEPYKIIINNWKKVPITSISINDSFLHSLNRKVNKEDLNDLSNMFIIKRMTKKFDYEYLLKEDIGDKNFHPCGTDEGNNHLFLPKNIECPINEIEITQSSSPSKSEFNYITVKIYDNLFLHYTNNNIDGKIVNDFYLDLLFSYSSSYDTNYEFRFSSEELPLLNSGQYLSVFIDFYKSYSFNYDVGYEKRDLTRFHFIINGKFYQYLLNSISLIILIIIFINIILTLISENLVGFIFINFTLLYIDICIEVFLNYYVFNDEKDIFVYLNDMGKNQNLKIKYNFIQLCIIISFAFFYQISNSSLFPLSNYYYYLVYPCRYGFTCKIFDRCKKSQKEKHIIIINNIDNELKDLNHKLKEYNEEKLKMKDENKNILTELHEKYKELNKLKEKSKMEINFHFEENFIIKFKNEIEDLEKNKKNEVDELKKLNKEIDDTEKKINFYKMKNFNDQILNKPIIY